MDLRRRARRRLVGAVALALLAVVVLPMVLDPEPRPLADNVEIHIPDQSLPFQPSQPAPTGQAETAAQAPDAAAEPAAAAPEAAAAAEPAAVDRPEMPTKDAPVSRPEAKAKTVVPPAPKTAAIAAAKPADKPADKRKATADEAYFLQLGVFSSRANADQMVARAKVAGFKAAVSQNGGQFKVRVGPIGDRAKALDYQAKLKARGLDNVLVDS
jgi:DedD protein